MIRRAVAPGSACFNNQSRHSPWLARSAYFFCFFTGLSCRSGVGLVFFSTGFFFFFGLFGVLSPMQRSSGANLRAKEYKYIIDYRSVRWPNADRRDFALYRQ
jgi:hypothetical protein